ncbi:hypothetical protein BpHYR1_008997 [Brachionus plicatilis]|uniref:Uncharacterized protein n=1 Tax=Brachionus plicatilis TaxID=10195 RepID=A0A3M7QCZ6_BRAPC|nr:hypothetical protein BpHYR1_008997 [Brachionus plicatilis]
MTVPGRPTERPLNGQPCAQNVFFFGRPPHDRSVSWPATTRSVRQLAGHFTVGPSVGRPPHGRSVSWPAFLKTDYSIIRLFNSRTIRLFDYPAFQDLSFRLINRIPKDDARCLSLSQTMCFSKILIYVSFVTD